MGLRAVFQKRWKSAHFRQSFWIGLVAILGGAIVAAMIQTRFDLYSASFTMTLVGMAAAVVAMLIIWLLDRRWYGWAWAATIIAPVAVFLAFIAVLDGNPPKPPLG